MPKGNGGHHDIHLFPGKPILMKAAKVISKACMIRKILKPEVIQLRRDGIHIIPAQAINDPGFIGMFLQEVGYLGDNMGTRPHPVGQIGTVHRADMGFRVFEAELLQNVPLNSLVAVAVNACTAIGLKASFMIPRLR